MLGRCLGRCLNNTSPQETPCTSAFQKVWGGMEVFSRKRKKEKEKRRKVKAMLLGDESCPFEG